jgi:diadenosine tetraphosphate (Ap4A) HIT family hydrolase
MRDPDCLFCKIVAGEAPSQKVWEDEHHLAFLTIFPNTEGATVVIPKEHYPSYPFDLPDDVLTSFILAAKKTAKVLDAGFPDVARTALVFEGMAINHVHAKLYPLHGTKTEGGWKPMHSGRNEYFETYPGYVSSHDAPRADDAKLEALAKRLRNEA